MPSSPAVVIGSMARTMPSSSSGPVPGSPWLAICGSSCISRPTPWPTSERTTAKPSASTLRWTAAETSPRGLPGRRWPPASMVDPFEERLAGALHQPGGDRGDGADRDRDGGVRDPPVQHHADVDREDVAA